MTQQIIYEAPSNLEYNCGTAYSMSLKGYLSSGLIGEHIQEVKNIKIDTGTYPTEVTVFHHCGPGDCSTLVLETSFGIDRLLAETSCYGIKNLKKGLVEKIKEARVASKKA